MKILKKAGLTLSVFLLFSALCCVGFSGYAQTKNAAAKNVSKVENKTVNNFTTPDFAFPETVDTNAEKELEAALSSGDDVKALRAAMQIVIAQNLISRDNYPEGIALFDRLGKELHQPYSQLALMLKAQILTSIYQSEPWTFNNRTLPLNPVPENVLEWSRDIFSSQITSIIKGVFEDTEIARSIPISKISAIIENDKDALKMDMSVYDFMTLKSGDILGGFADYNSDEVIPFYGVSKGNKQTELSAYSLLNSIIDDNISRHEKEGDTRLASFMSYYKYDNMPWRERKVFAAKCVDKYIDTPYCAAFILAQGDYDEDSIEDSESDALAKKNLSLKNRYAQITAYLKRFPSCDNAKALENKLTVLGAEKISASVSDRIYPGEKGRFKVGVSNVFDFNILVVKVPDSYINRSINLNAVSGIGKVVATVPVSFSGEKPVVFEQEFELPVLNSGVYMLVPSKTQTLNGIITGTAPKLSMSTFTVSNLSTIRVTGDKASQNRLYVVDGKNQKPVSDAKVTFTPMYRNGKAIQSVTRLTSNEGYVAVPEGAFNIKISKGKDILACDIWNNSNSQRNDSRMLRGKVLCDLSVYHPGDSVGYLGILYSQQGREMHWQPETDIKVELLDANRQTLDSVSLKADQFGRVSDKFRIPETGLLGEYVIRMVDKSKNSDICSGYFQVAEYKSPTFYVITDGVEDGYQVGDTIRIKGKAMTYSGVPVSEAAVRFDIHYMPLRWMSANVNASYGGETKTNADGTFVITLPTQGLKGTRFAFGGYRLNVAVTELSGETQSALAISFSLGRAYSISSQMPEIICAGNGPQNFTVRVSDIVGKPVKKMVRYLITEDGDSNKTILEGSFESPVFNFVPAALPSGKYKISFRVDDSESSANSDAFSTIIIYRSEDKHPPYKTPLWIPKDRIVAEKDAKTVKVNVGSAYDSWLFMQIADCDKVIERKWLHVDNSITEVEVPAPADNNQIKITFAGMNDFNQIINSVTIIPEAQTEQIRIKAESFRDKLTPGAREEWKFSFTLSDNKLAGIPVSAVMSNKALDAIVPFRWNFNPSGNVYYNVTGGVQSLYFNHGSSWTLPLSKERYGGQDRIVYPAWNFYDLSLYGAERMMRKLKIRGTAVTEQSYAVMNTSVKNEMKVMDVAVEEEADAVYMAAPEAAGAAMKESVVEGSADNGNSEMRSEEPLRDIECPLAFFMPQLVTDNDGSSIVDFDVPDFNGTWQFQIMGYTENMKGAVAMMDAVASKPVMVKMNAPRFLRTGDKASVSAMLYNNSSEVLNLKGRIELFDVMNGDILARKEFGGEKTDPAGSVQISLLWDVPDNINYLGIRAYAFSEDFSDGEQTVIPVYPSSTPVLESKPFYIAPGQEEFSMKIPSFGKDSKVTLQYCDNPVWEVVTALPAIIEPKGSDILSQLNSFYGNAVGAGLTDRYPEIVEALKLFADPANSADSTLVSNLEKNQDLKTVVLNNTPWVRSANAETLRMQSLIKYADKETCRSAIASALKEIGKLQNADGGWSWCAGMKSSDYMTSCVLNQLGMLRNMGYLPAEAEAMAKKGVKYVDQSWVKREREYKGAKFPYISMLNYLYIRSNFEDVVKTPEFKAMAVKGVGAVKSEWKKMSIYEKAIAAVLLHRSGYNMESRTILESLRQYASFKEDKGMWFDNLSSSWGAQDKLLTTAKVLEAYNGIEPSSPDIDKLRQWLLISRQTENWGADRATAEVIYAVLSTGTAWTVPSDPAEIWIGGKKIESDRIAALTGNITVNVNNFDLNELKISRKAAGPAWGGLISQYIAPIKDVKAAKIPELSITKKLYVITDSENGSAAAEGPIAVGDKVRITLTISCDRDLEYVAIMDSRSASLEPVDQVSGYSVSDGVWMYKETRNNSTNLFIPFLSKGTHVISYECYADRTGSYSLGIATAQSQYAPVIAAHSAGGIITIK